MNTLTLDIGAGCRLAIVSLDEQLWSELRRRTGSPTIVVVELVGSKERTRPIVEDEEADEPRQGFPPCDIY